MESPREKISALASWGPDTPPILHDYEISSNFFGLKEKILEKFWRHISAVALFPASLLLVPGHCMTKVADLVPDNSISEQVERIFD